MGEGFRCPVDAQLACAFHDDSRQSSCISPLHLRLDHYFPNCHAVPTQGVSHVCTRSCMQTASSIKSRSYTGSGQPHISSAGCSCSAPGTGGEEGGGGASGGSTAQQPPAAGRQPVCCYIPLGAYFLLLIINKGMFVLGPAQQLLQVSHQTSAHSCCCCCRDLTNNAALCNPLPNITTLSPASPSRLAFPPCTPSMAYAQANFNTTPSATLPPLPPPSPAESSPSPANSHWEQPTAYHMSSGINVSVSVLVGLCFLLGLCAGFVRIRQQQRRHRVSSQAPLLTLPATKVVQNYACCCFQTPSPTTY